MGEEMVIEMKTYLDEKFKAIDDRFSHLDNQIMKLDSKLDGEHDKVLSSEMDISSVKDDIIDINRRMVDCQVACSRRKSDLNNFVNEKITASQKGLLLKILVPIVPLLLSIIGFMFFNLFMKPVEDHLGKNKQIKKIERYKL